MSRWQKRGAYSVDFGFSVRGGNFDPFLSPEAWYVLTSTDYTADQSGNGHTLGGSAPTFQQGRYLGQVASRNVALAETAPSSVWRTAGAVSCVSFANINSSAGDRWFASCEISGGFFTWWKFGVGSDGRACYGVNDGIGSTFFQWGPVLPTTGWHTIGWSRAANGHDVSVFLDGVLQGSGTVARSPAGGAAAVLTVGKDFFQPAQPYIQQLTALWLVELTASQNLQLSRRIQGA